MGQFLYSRNELGKIAEDFSIILPSGNPLSFKDHTNYGLSVLENVSAFTTLENPKLNYIKSVFAKLLTCKGTSSKNRNIGVEERLIKVLVVFPVFFLIPMAKTLLTQTFPNQFLPFVLTVTLAAVVIFFITALNIYVDIPTSEIKSVNNIWAVGGLLILTVFLLIQLTIENITTYPFPNVFSGTFAANPFAISILTLPEGAAKVTGLNLNPKVNNLLGFGGVIITLVVLYIITFLSSVWVKFKSVFYPLQGTAVLDSPLPLALKNPAGKFNNLYFPAFIKVKAAILAVNFCRTVKALICNTLIAASLFQFRIKNYWLVCD